MTEKKISYHAFIDSEYKYYSTDTPQNFSYNIEGFLPISENLNYIVNIEYVQIYHNTSTDDETYIPYYSYSYNVMIDFFKQNNILSNDQYINMYCGNTVDYEKFPYWNATTNTVNYDYSMSVSTLLGRDGPKFYIYKPKSIINIQILNDDGTALLDALGGVIPRVRLLLKFKPIN